MEITARQTRVAATKRAAAVAQEKPELLLLVRVMVGKAATGCSLILWASTTTGTQS